MTFVYRLKNIRANDGKYIVFRVGDNLCL